MSDVLNETPIAPEPRRWKPLLMGLALGLVVGGGAMFLARPKASAPQATQDTAQTWQCPMHPQIMQDHEGDCPICGMDLVPMTGAQALESPGPEGLVTVQIDAQRRQLMGLRTAVVEPGDLGGDLRLPGRVVLDETRLKKVTVKLEGYVERLQADFVGRPVSKGQVLFELYSPEFLNAQREYLVAQRTRASLAGTEQEARWLEIAGTARRRLEFLDAPPSLLAKLDATGEVVRHLPVVSPISGIVTVRNVAQGSRLGPADTALEMVDLSRVWVLADLYEQDLARVKPGMAAELELPALGRTVAGRVAFLDPMLDPKTRTLKARLEFPNPGGELRPDMFGEVRLKVGSRRVLTVPLDAILDSGTRKIAFVDVGQGYLEPREVQVGQSGRDRIEVVEGLEAGEQVVTRAAFLVDSESRLQAALAELARRKGEAAAAPQAPAADPHAGHRH